MDKIREYLADRGFGQYPLPRSRPKPPPQLNLGIRLGFGFAALLSTIFFGGFLLIVFFVIGVFIYAAFSGDQPQVIQ